MIKIKMPDNAPDLVKVFCVIERQVDNQGKPAGWGGFCKLCLTHFSAEETILLLYHEFYDHINRHYTDGWDALYYGKDYWPIVILHTQLMHIINSYFPSRVVSFLITKQITLKEAGGFNFVCELLGYNEISSFHKHYYGREDKLLKIKHFDQLKGYWRLIKYLWEHQLMSVQCSLCYAEYSSSPFTQIVLKHLEKCVDEHYKKIKANK